MESAGAVPTAGIPKKTKVVLAGSTNPGILFPTRNNSNSQRFTTPPGAITPTAILAAGSGLAGEAMAGGMVQEKSAIIAAALRHRENGGTKRKTLTRSVSASKLRSQDIKQGSAAQGGQYIYINECIYKEN